MIEFLTANMAPLMFGALVVFLLLGYPVAFALAANGIFFGIIGIELGMLQPSLFQALPQLDPVWRLALITGFLGALTTFSSFSAEVIAMLGQQKYALALGTAALHLFGSLLLTVAGMRTLGYFLPAH